MDNKPAIKPPARNIFLLVVLIIFGTIIGLMGTFFALIGTQAATGHEPFLPTLLEVAAFYVIVWSIAGLIVSLGVRGHRLKLKVLAGFVSGGLIAAFLETLFIVTLHGGDLTLFLCFIVPPATGITGVFLTLKQTRVERRSAP